MKTRLASALLLAGMPAALARDTHPVLSYPVDIANAGGGHVVAAHSFMRAMSQNYAGPLFKLFRTSDSTFTMISPNGPGGMVNMNAVQNFCGAANGNGCEYVTICDQIAGTCYGNASSGNTYGSAQISITTGTPGTINYPGNTLPNGTPVWFTAGSIQAWGTLPSGLSGYSANVTLTQSSPGVVTFPVNNAPITDCSPVQFTTTGSLPTGLSTGTTYYLRLPGTIVSGTLSKMGSVYGVGTANTCTSGPTLVNFTSAGSGTQTVTSTGISQIYYVVNSVSGLGGGTGSFQIATTAGGSPIAITSAGSGTIGLYTADNSMMATGGKVANLVITSLPSGVNTPVYSQYSGGGNTSVFRNRGGTIGLPLNAQTETVYGLFSTGYLSSCCGTYGNVEANEDASTGATSLGDTGNGHMQALGVAYGTTAYGGSCQGDGKASDLVHACLQIDIENGIWGSGNTLSGTSVSGSVIGTTMTVTSATGFPTWLYGLQPGMTFACAALSPSSGSTPAETLPTVTAGGPATSGTFTVNVSYASTINFTNCVVNQSQPLIYSSFVSGFGSSDGYNIWLDVGSEQTPATNIYGGANSSNAPSGKEGGLTLGEGGDKSAAPTIFLEGFVSNGMVPPDARARINAANFQLLNSSGPPAGSAYNFTNGSITSSSLPKGWSFSRAACSGNTGGINGSGGCATNAQYTDAAGSNSYSNFADGSSGAIIDSNGLWLFAASTEYITHNDCVYESSCAPAPPSSNLNTGYYQFFCSGVSGAYVTITPGTAVMQVGGTTQSSITQNCNNGSWTDIHITTAGTWTIAYSGTLYWVDLQKNPQATAGIPPLPHVIAGTGTAAQTRAADIMTIGNGSGTISQEYTWLESATATVIGDWVPVSNQQGAASVTYRPLIGPSATGGFEIWQDGSTFKSGTMASSADAAAFYTQTVSYGTEYRFGGTMGQGTYWAAYEGTFTMMDNSTSSAMLNPTRGITHYLGWDNFKSSSCECIIKQVAFYPYILGRVALSAKTALGAPLP